MKRDRNSDVTRRDFMAFSLAGGVVAINRSVASANAAEKEGGQRRISVGYHFWSCSREWDHDLDRCLRLAKETGYAGFEAMSDRTQVTAAVFKEKCKRIGLTCAAIDGSGKERIDFAHEAGIRLLRCQVDKEESRRRVRYAGDRNVRLMVHNHIGQGGQGTGSVETRDDLLRYLDERPGTYACPDTGHLLLCGDDPAQTILDLGERCVHVHLKDVNPESVGKGKKMKNMWFELGTGALDIASVMNALEKIRFAGWVVIEYGNQVDDYHQSARNMRQAMKKIGY